MLNELRIDKETTHKTTVKLQENIELLIGETRVFGEIKAFTLDSSYMVRTETGGHIPYIILYLI